MEPRSAGVERRQPSLTSMSESALCTQPGTEMPQPRGPSRVENTSHLRSLLLLPTSPALQSTLLAPAGSRDCPVWRGRLRPPLASPSGFSELSVAFAPCRSFVELSAGALCVRQQGCWSLLGKAMMLPGVGEDSCIGEQSRGQRYLPLVSRCTAQGAAPKPNLPWGSRTAGHPGIVESTLTQGTIRRYRVQGH